MFILPCIVQRSHKRKCHIFPWLSLKEFEFLSYYRIQIFQSIVCKSLWFLWHEPFRNELFLRNEMLGHWWFTAPPPPLSLTRTILSVFLDNLRVPAYNPSRREDLGKMRCSLNSFIPVNNLTQFTMKRLKYARSPYSRWQTWRRRVAWSVTSIGHQKVQNRMVTFE